jgi:hypothetical protein
MASVLRSVKQTPVNGAFFVNLGDIRANVVQNYGASAEAPLISTASWVTSNSTVSASLSVAGRAFLRDMGVNLVSSGRTFRKVQMLTSAAANVSTGGVNGAATGSSSDYLTGYIEVPGGAGNVSGVIPTTLVARV